MARLVLLTTLLLLLATALPTVAQSDGTGDSDGPAIIPILASSETAQGPNRFLFGLTDSSGMSIAAPDVAIHLRFYDDSADPEAVVFETDSRFVWAIEDVRGLYAADVTFPHAGRWGTRFDATFPDGNVETVRVDYDVRETTSTPAIGSAAPAIETPTAADVDGDLALISTDPEPMARLYELSLADAIEADAPFVLAFATPSFCQTATCGPTLEKVKAVAQTHPDVNFVHVEPYLMTVGDDGLRPLLSEEGFLQPAAWTELWGLRTEPYVVVVAADGTVRAKYEGAISTEELEEALAAL